MQKNRIYSQTPTMEIKSDPHALLNFVGDSLKRKITRGISKPVKITQFQTKLKLHYVGAIINPQDKGKIH